MRNILTNVLFFKFALDKNQGNLLEKDLNSHNHNHSRSHSHSDRELRLEELKKQGRVA